MHNFYTTLQCSGAPGTSRKKTTRCKVAKKLFEQLDENYACKQLPVFKLLEQSDYWKDHGIEIPSIPQSGGKNQS